MRTIMEFITQSAVKICYEFLRLLSCICWGTPKNMDIAEWNNKVGYILSFLSSLSRRVRTNAAKMHHVVKTWCIVSMSGRFAKSAPPVRSAGGAFCRFPVPLCICPPLPLSRCVGTNSVKMYCACSVRVQLPLSAKFKYCFINCSLYFADNVLYYQCAESEGSL